MKTIGLLSLLLLSACGFAPVYGTYSQGAATSEASATLNTIQISPLPDREGQFLRNALVDRFYKDGYPATPLYTLTILPLNEEITDYDITVESEATRRQLKITAPITLKSLENNQILLNLPLYAMSSYNVLESEFATRVSEQKIREAVLNDLARQIEQRITLNLNKK